MTEGEAPPADGGTMPGRIRGPQDFYGGLIMIVIGLFAIWATWELPGMHGFSFGPGTAPRMFATLLVLFGIGISVTGYLVEGSPLARYAIRGPLFVTLSILAFAVAIRPAGLVASSFLSFMIAALGTAETRWLESVIVGIAITVFCSLLFPYALGLPFELWPRFLQ
jgi:putative tricarboxylic transport membrane protein